LVFRFADAEGSRAGLLCRAAKIAGFRWAYAPGMPGDSVSLSNGALDAINGNLEGRSVNRGIRWSIRGGKTLHRVLHKLGLALSIAKRGLGNSHKK
jgi:hypothetical protein